ncbi:hypothetical protein [Methylotuvimicrobium buryatense]|uniref:Uncharacterized protein n=1 Tax=Methylotuvimicrobium buryatense TaxID=95641 RepID=A0A4P9UJ20_METBY|nr:hypothetical protein [Methylotuvimicrobium buryatense]QCW80977.1 hypothetical protein EQU24_00925 [Methylotuvimicrobium buryatense]
MNIKALPSLHWISPIPTGMQRFSLKFGAMAKRLIKTVLNNTALIRLKYNFFGVILPGILTLNVFHGIGISRHSIINPKSRE